VLLGNFAQQHPQAAQITILAAQIAQLCDAKFGYLGEAANSVGGYLAGAVPFENQGNGMNAMQMLSMPRKAYVLLNVEPELDMHDPQLAMKAIKSADMVVALSAFKHQAVDYADVMLPIAPFTETSGTFVSTEGRVQSFKGAVKPLGDARPSWKVLRVLGNLLGIDGFDYESSEAIRDQILSVKPVADRLDNRVTDIELKLSGTLGSESLQRVSHVPIYSADSLVRRAEALQETADALAPVVIMNSTELQKIGAIPGSQVKVSQGEGSVNLLVKPDDSLPLGVVRIAAGHAATAALGAMFGVITVERA
jgi:NADH-quinone oxidoreductase subunit G